MSINGPSFPEDDLGKLSQNQCCLFSAGSPLNPSVFTSDKQTPNNIQSFDLGVCSQKANK